MAKMQFVVLAWIFSKMVIFERSNVEECYSVKKKLWNESLWRCAIFSRCGSLCVIIKGGGEDCGLFSKKKFFLKFKKMTSMGVILCEKSIPRISEA